MGAKVAYIFGTLYSVGCPCVPVSYWLGVKHHVTSQSLSRLRRATDNVSLPLAYHQKPKKPPPPTFSLMRSLVRGC